MNRDFSDMLSALNAEHAEYLLVGAYALAVHGVVRGTGDLDLWVRPELENAHRVWTALAKFGAPLDRLSEPDLASPGMVFQIGVAPQRIDLLTSIDGVEFEDAWQRRVLHAVAENTIPVLSATDLIRNKLATGRQQDRVDAERLSKHLRLSLES